MKQMSLKQQKFFSAIPNSWKKPLEEVCKESKIDSLINFLQERESAGATIYPEKKNIFAALHATPFTKATVVIIGQDPYHGANQAHGLCFSVQHGIKQPPSLKNIFKELHNDIDMATPASGSLTGWAKQGVIMLNSILTVEASKPASHAGHGWEFFTDAIIEQILKRNQPTVLILWGAYAQKKLQNLDAHLDPLNHLILKAAHPSPYSVTKFLGCKHFSKANNFLKKCGLPNINWSATE
jgi:uracil-DNA glycosylase